MTEPGRYPVTNGVIDLGDFCRAVPRADGRLQLIDYDPARDESDIVTLDRDQLRAALDHLDHERERQQADADDDVTTDGGDIWRDANAADRRLLGSTEADR